MSVVEFAYNDRANTIDLSLTADGTAVDLSAVTRMVLEDIGGTFSIDEDDDASVFNRDVGVTGKVVIALGGQGIAAGRYQVRLIVYDPTNDDGIVWDGGGFTLHVV